MERQNETAGKTATTNEFDAEIVRLKQERKERHNEIDQRISELLKRNDELIDKYKANRAQVNQLCREKAQINKEYKQKIAAITEKKDYYYCNRIRSVHHKRFAAFCDLHPEVLQMWREFRQAEEGGAQ